MPVYRINQFPEGSGSLSSDDVFIFMDDPSGSGITKKITLSQISDAVGGGGASTTVVQLGIVSGTINTDASLGDIFDLSLTGSGLLTNPTNGSDGQSLRWRISYANSGIPLTLGDSFRIPSSASNPLPFSSSSGVMDMLGATYDTSRNKWDIIAFVPGY